jgi:hypothetical protein
MRLNYGVVELGIVVGGLDGRRELQDPLAAGLQLALDFGFLPQQKTASYAA